MPLNCVAIVVCERALHATRKACNHISSKSTEPMHQFETYTYQLAAWTGNFVSRIWKWLRVSNAIQQIIFEQLTCEIEMHDRFCSADALLLKFDEAKYIYFAGIVSPATFISSTRNVYDGVGCQPVCDKRDANTFDLRLTFCTDVFIIYWIYSIKLIRACCIDFALIHLVDYPAGQILLRIEMDVCRVWITKIETNFANRHMCTDSQRQSLQQSCSEV